jgi:drug/metabolite transporter (DMT)-like permease
MLTLAKIFETIGSFVLVSLIWGITNPFLGQAAKREEDADSSKSSSGRKQEVSGQQAKKGNGSFIGSALWQLVKFFSNWRFWVPYGINQLGSVLYNYLLGTSDISLSSPICNSLTFVVTGITAKLLGEKQPTNWKTFSGAALILGGVALCTAAKLEADEGKR